MNIESNDINKKEEFISSHRDEWQRIGSQLKVSRTQLDISRNQVAVNINVSVSRLRNLELGNPVNDAKLLIAAYKNFIKLKTYERALKYNALLLIRP